MKLAGDPASMTWGRVNLLCEKCLQVGGMPVIALAMGAWLILAAL